MDLPKQAGVSASGYDGAPSASGYDDASMYKPICKKGLNCYLYKKNDRKHIEKFDHIDDDGVEYNEYDADEHNAAAAAAIAATAASSRLSRAPSTTMSGFATAPRYGRGEGFGMSAAQAANPFATPAVRPLAAASKWGADSKKVNDLNTMFSKLGFQGGKTLRRKTKKHHNKKRVSRKK